MTRHVVADARLTKRLDQNAGSTDVALLLPQRSTRAGTIGGGRASLAVV